MQRLALRRISSLAALVALAITGGCDTVAYYEMKSFTDPSMTLDDDATATHAYQKIYYSIEGSAGGIGTSAGGGCGCY